MYHQRDLYNRMKKYETDVINVIRFAADESVQFVTLTPVELPGINKFTISFRMSCKMLAGSETVSSESECYTFGDPLPAYLPVTFTIIHLAQTIQR